MSALLLDSPNLPDLSPLKKHEQLTSMLIQALEHHTCRQVFEAPLGQYLLEHFAFFVPELSKRCLEEGDLSLLEELLSPKTYPMHSDLKSKSMIASVCVLLATRSDLNEEVSSVLVNENTSSLWQEMIDQGLITSQLHMFAQTPSPFFNKLFNHISIPSDQMMRFLLTPHLSERLVVDCPMYSTLLLDAFQKSVKKEDQEKVINTLHSHPHTKVCLQNGLLKQDIQEELNKTPKDISSSSLRKM